MNKGSSLPTASDFETEIRKCWVLAMKQGAPYIDIKAGELHRKLGGYPARGGHHRMPNCCQVMKRIMQSGDKSVYGSPKAEGASLVVRYVFPRTQNQDWSGTEDIFMPSNPP